MGISQEKGKDLENAVHAIESMILESNPALINSNLMIEKNKKIRENGVLHEIDIFVNIDLGKGYNSTYLFECKNWDHAKVGKNEIISFIEKIKVTASQKGFFLAKSFTKDAIAQAKLDNRLELKIVDDSLFDLRNFPHAQHAENVIEENLTYKLSYSTLNSDDFVDIDDVESFLENDFIVKGNKVDSNEFLRKFIIHKTIDDRIKSVPSHTFDPGIYPYKNSLIFTFKKGFLNISGIDPEIEKLRIDLNFGIEIAKAIVKSSYIIEDKGKVVTMVYNFTTREPVQIGFVEI